MREHIDGHYIAAEVRLFRQKHKGTIVLLEGEGDAKVFDEFINTEYSQSQVSYGKQNAICALQLLEDEGFPGILAIVDADLDRVLGVTYDCDNLFYCDTHDLDLMLFRSDALRKYLSHCADAALLEKNFGGIDKFRSAILTAILPLAYCRLTNERMKLEMDFKRLRLDQHVDENTLELNGDSAFEEILVGSRAKCELSDLKKMNVHSIGICGDPWQLAHGHDVCELVGIALRRLVGGRKIPQTWGSEVEKGLRLAFDESAFKKTDIYSKLIVWEGSDARYQLFRRDA